MGNCLVLQEKVIKVMKIDGKILEYKSPIKVQEILEEFSGYAISDSLSEIRHLRPDFKPLGGNLYFLVPMPFPTPKVAKKKVRFLDKEGEDGEKEVGVVRIKLVISKQELENLLQKGGISVKDMVSQIQNSKQSADDGQDGDSRKGWKPELESIPESDESYVLPIILQYDDQPEIDEEGNILYRFPSLQRTASQRSERKEYLGRRWANAVGGVEKDFREKKCKTNMSERGMAIGLGGLNLFRVIILGAMLQEIATPIGFIKFVAYIFTLLQIYAGSFFAIPVVRWFLNVKRNADIEKRNRMRENYAQALESPDLSLRSKLLGARDMA